MMKIAVALMSHETNTFSTIKTNIELFKQGVWGMGHHFLETQRGVRSCVGGMIDQAEQQGVEIIPIIGAHTQPSGLIERDTYEHIKSELLNGLRQSAPFDAVCLCLHGAGVAEGYEDIEGDLLYEVRKQIGRSILLVSKLYLHANVTEKMVKEADILVGDHHYPHIDMYDRGKDAIDYAVQMVEGKLKPVMHLNKLPLLIPTSTSGRHPVNQINQLCREHEKNENVPICTLYHGFPYADIEQASVSVLVVTNENEQLAVQISEEVGEQVMKVKKDFFRNYPTPHEGIRSALQASDRPVIINETSDNPGAGAPGDGTHLLRAMIESDLTDVCFGFIFDPETAEQAHKSGVGTTIQVKLGGKTDEMHGKPIQADAYVKSLTDGRFIKTSPMGRGGKTNLGRSARLQINGVDVIVTSVRNQVFDEQVFLLHGIDIHAFHIVALKSSHHFRAAFEPLSKEIITVDSPGLSTMDFTSFPYEKIGKQNYPLATE